MSISKQKMSVATKASDGIIAGAYVGTFGLQILMAAFAVYITYSYFKKRASNETTEHFMTARKSLGAYRIGWSFYAGAVGAWVITSPSSYASYAGILGLVIYAITSGLPLIMIAAFGGILQERFPDIMSSGDFARARFGPVSQLLVILLTIFNMSIALMAEYVSMGILFRDFLGSVNYGIIIFYGILTLLYTAYGGLYISIITDSIQGVVSVILAVIAFWYVVGTFRFDFLNSRDWVLFNGGDAAAAAAMPLKSLPTDLAIGFRSGYDENARAGLASLCAFPVSLFCATIFSEAMWQRCWASESKKTLMKASILGCTGVIIIVFVSGFAGWIGAWAGFFHPNFNLQLFMAYKPQAEALPPFDGGVPGKTYTTYANIWISVFTIICAGVMSQGAVDSLQNGLTCTITAYFFRNKNVSWARAVVVVINAILIGVAAGTNGVSVLSLFLVTNLLTSCCALPMMSGFFDKDGKYISGDMMVFSSIFSVFALSAFGTGLRWHDAINAGRSGAYKFRYGMKWTWYANNYDYKVFLVAVFSSFFGLVLAWGIGWVVRKFYKGPGLNEYFVVYGPGIKAKIVGGLQRTPLRKLVDLYLKDDDNVYERAATPAKGEALAPSTDSDSEAKLKLEAADTAAAQPTLYATEEAAPAVETTPNA